MLYIIKAILLNVFLIGSAYAFGKVVTRKRAVNNIAIGFCAYLGILELLSFWTVAFSKEKIYFIFIAVLLYIAFLVVSFVMKKEKIDIKRVFSENFVWIALTFVLIILVSLLYRSDADDSFYVSNAMLFQNSNILNLYDSSFGNDELGTVPMYDFQIWESLVAVIASAFSLEAVSVMHIFMLPVLLVLSASAYLFLGSILIDTNDMRKSTLFYIFITIFHLFGGYAAYSEGSFLLSRQWQGKAVYLTIVLPVMVAILLKSIKEDNKLLWCYTAICMLAGMALNPTSLYVLGFEVLFMVIAIAICKKRLSYILNIIPSGIVAVSFTIMIYLRTSQYGGQIEAASNTDKSFIFDTFKSFWGTGGLYLVLYLLSIAIILWKGSKEAKVYSVFVPVLLLLFIWNPYLGRIIAEKVTKVPSYWRVFWLIPVGTSVAYAGTLLIANFRSKWGRYICFCGIAFCICFSGKWMFSKSNGFVSAKNYERIPDDSIEFGKIITEDKSKAIVLGGDSFSTTLRQKYSDIELIYSRYQYLLDLYLYRGKEEEFQDRVRMMDFINGHLTEYSDMKYLLDKYKVDYIIIAKAQEKEQFFLIETGEWDVKESSERNILFERAK